MQWLKPVLECYCDAILIMDPQLLKIFLKLDHWSPNFVLRLHSQNGKPYITLNRNYLLLIFFILRIVQDFDIQEGRVSKGRVEFQKHLSEISNVSSVSRSSRSSGFGTWSSSGAPDTDTETNTVSSYSYYIHHLNVIYISFWFIWKRR